MEKLVCAVLNRGTSKKFGFKNLMGQWVIEPIYDKAGDFDEYGFARVTLDGIWHLIDHSGETVISQTLEYFYYNDLYNLEHEGKTYTIEAEGRILSSPPLYEVFKKTRTSCGISETRHPQRERLAKIRYRGKWGIISHESKWIYKPEFDDILCDDSYDDTARVKLNGKWGIISRDGSWILPPEFERLKDLNLWENSREALAGPFMAKSRDAWGIADRDAKWIIPPVFDDIRKHNKADQYAVKFETKWGILSQEGNWILKPCMYDLPDPYEKYFPKLNYDDKWGVIDEQLEWIIPAIFESADIKKLPYIKFDELGLSLAANNGKWGFIDKEGEWVIDPGFEYLEAFDETDEIAQAALEERYGFIDLQGEWVIQPRFEFVDDCFDSKYYARAGANGKLGFIGMDGHWIIPPEFDFVDQFPYDQDTTRASVNDRWGLIDRTGKWVVEPTLTWIKHDVNSSGHWKVSMNDDWGYMDCAGKWAIPPLFDDIESFTDFLPARAYLHGKCGIIRPDGSWQIEPLFDDIRFFYTYRTNMYMEFLNGHFVGIIDGKQGLIDAAGNWLLRPEFDEISYVADDDYARVRTGTRWGVIGLDGAWRIHPGFHYILNFNPENGLAFACIGRKKGFIDQAGEWVQTEDV